MRLNVPQKKKKSFVSANCSIGFSIIMCSRLSATDGWQAIIILFNFSSPYSLPVCYITIITIIANNFVGKFIFVIKLRREKREMQK